MTHAESLALNDTGRASATLVPPLCHPCATLVPVSCLVPECHWLCQCVELTG